MPKLARGQPALVTPTVLEWARSRASLDIDLAAQQLGISTSTLVSWEAGNGSPTVPQLRKIAQAYRKPIALFFLEEPPQGFSVMEDYRVHRISESKNISKLLAIEIDGAHEKRSALLDVAEEIDEIFLPFGISVKLDNNPVAIARIIRDTIGIKFENQISWRSTEIALKNWISALENLDILIFQSSNFDLFEARGFSLYYDVLPIIFVNGKDAPAGKIFTIVHELIHLAVINGDSDLMTRFDADAARRKKLNDQIESFCNSVATEVILPNEQFMSNVMVQRINDENITTESLSAIARNFP